MKKLLYFIPMLLGLVLSSCYQDEIDDLKNRLEAIEGTHIASLQEQIDNIKSTLPELVKADGELEAYIEDLQTTATNLQEAIDATNVKIDEVKATLQSDLLTQLSLLKGEMEEELNLVNTTIADLQIKKEQLEKKITDLTSYVDNELASNKDWANATFATLEQYSSLAGEVATIKADIELINQSITDLESRLGEKIATDINTAVSELNTTIQEKVSEITTAYTSAISAAKSEIIAAYTAAIATTFSLLESSMKAWVSDQLKGYYTIAEMEGKLAALQNAISEQDLALQEEIEALITTLATTKAEITESYESAIEEAINKNNGIVDGKIAVAIAEVNIRIENEIKAINAKIAAIESRLDKAESDIATISEQIANINNTIATLEEADAELENYIKSLQTTADNLQKAINDTNTKIDNIKSALQTEASATKTEILAQLASLKAEIEAELSKINDTIASLQAKDAELNNRISELRSYVDTELANNRDWANATFATLEQYSSLAGEVATIKAQIAAVNQAITDLDTYITAKIEENIATAIEPIKDQLVAEVITNVTTAYQQAVADAKSEITAAYTAAISSAISTLESSMKSWVSNQLKSYYTIAEVEGKLAVLQSAITNGDKYLQSEVDALIQSLANAKAELTKAYKEAIEKAINENNGVVDGKILAAITEVNARIDSEIATLNTKIATLENRLKKVENDIATINEQISAINSTIEELINGKNELNEYIKALQAAASNLQQSINATNATIDEVTKFLQSEVSAAKVELLTALSALREEMNGELAQINATIAALQAKDAELDKKISDLRSYVDNELANNKDWANATFATLEQHNALAAEVATIKAHIAAIDTRIAELEARINEKIDSDIAAAVSTLNTTIQTKVEEITSAYTSAISTAKEEITAAYTTAIEEAISALDHSLKSWVSTQLQNYYTIAEVEGKLAALLATVTEGDKALSAEIASLSKVLAETKAEITTAYKNAIAEAISEHDGVINEKIAAEIAAVNSRIDQEIATINEKIATINSRLEKIESDIADLMNRIQSVSYVPQYTDGKASLSYNHSVSRVRLDFEIKPKEAVHQLAEVWESVLSAKAVLTRTRAVEFIAMPIVSFGADESTGVISMYLSGDNLLQRCLDGNMSPSIAIEISDGKNSITSDYIPTVVEEVTKEIWYTSDNNKAITPYRSNVFGANIISNIYELGMGVIRFDGNITHIGDKAFYSNNELVEITLPASVTSIGNQAFANCYSLKSVIMGDNVQNIGQQAFSNIAMLRTITLPESVTSIQSTAFMGTSLTSFDSKFASADGRCLIVDGTLTHFANRGLTEYSVPSGVTKIGDYVFSYCQDYTTITLPAGVTEIGEKAFYDCQTLKDFVIPESVTKIGNSAFYNCWKLREITIPRNVTYIGQNTFEDCYGLTKVDCKPLTPPVGRSMFSGVDDFVVNVSIGALSDYRNSEYWSEYNDHIEAVVDPNAKITYTTTDNKVVTPKTSAFNGLTLAYNSCDGGIGMMVFDGDIQTIGYEAFANCTTLKTITLPECVTTIGQNAFKGCTNLTEFTIGENLTSIGMDALSGCTKLENVFINRADILPGYLFENSKITNLYVNCNLPDGRPLGNATYTNIFFGDGVTSIGQNAFGDNCKITNISISNSVTNIGANAFYGSTIEKVTIPDSVTEMGSSAFAYCKNLTDAVIGSGLSVINSNTFYNCTSLKSVTIPASVTQVYYNSFVGCSALSEVYCKATTPPSFNGYSYSSVFGGGPDNRITYVPSESKSDYASSSWGNTFLMGYNYTTNAITPPANNEIWYTTTDGKAISIYDDYFDQTIVSNTYKNGMGIITFSGDLTEIKQSAFHSGQVRTIYIPASVKTLHCCNYDGTNGNYGSAFNSYLEEVHIAGSPDLTGNPFFGCYQLKKISGPLATADGRALVKGTTLYAYAFGSPETEFTIPSNIKTISYAAFYYTYVNTRHKLQKINIPASVTTFKYDAFYDCRVSVNLTSLESWCKATFANMYANPIYTGGMPVYLNGTQITTLTIPTTITTINKYAFAGVNVESIVITDNVTTIADNGFDWNKATSVTIGKKVSSIGKNAFRDNDSYNMTTLYVKPTTPPTIDSSTFTGYTNTIYVPKSYLSTYKSRSTWSNYSSQMVGYTF